MLHYWIERNFGKPYKCEICGGKKTKRYEWANLDGNYCHDPFHWKQMCVSCHRKYDYGGLCKKGLHLMTENNLYIVPNTGHRECLTCRKRRRKEQYLKFKQAKILRELK